MTDTLNTIGFTFPSVEGVERDAVHVAVYPVIADEILQPGQRIGFIEHDKQRVRACSDVDCIGIVDPFLTSQVVVGGCFWMFVLPRRIRGLTHHWYLDEIDSSSESETWLRDFAADCHMSYRDLLQSVKDGLETGYIWVGDNEDVSSEDTMRELLDHYSVVMNEKVAEGEAERLFFRCGC